jgi:hypothetical protein
MNDRTVVVVGEIVELALVLIAQAGLPEPWFLVIMRRPPKFWPPPRLHNEVPEWQEDVGVDEAVQCSQEVRVPREWSIEFLGEAVMDFHPRNVRKGGDRDPLILVLPIAQEVAEACRDRDGLPTARAGPDREQAAPVLDYVLLLRRGCH